MNRKMMVGIACWTVCACLFVQSAAAVSLPTGPFVITLNDWSMGTVYTNPDPATGEYDINDPANTFPSQGAWNLTQNRAWVANDDIADLEDAWGVFAIDHIYYGRFTAMGGVAIDETQAPYYSLNTSDTALVGMFYGLTDLEALAGPSGTLLTASTGMQMKVWEQDKLDGGGNMFGEVGSAGRVALDEYAGMGPHGPNASLWAECAGQAGFMLNPNADFSAVFQPDYWSGSGNAKSFLDVVDGAIYDDYVVTDLLQEYFEAPAGERAHLFMNMATDVNNPLNVPGGLNGDGDDWTTISNDDTVGYVPEPTEILSSVVDGEFAITRRDP